MKTAIVYVGQLRTWRKAIPTWYDLFSKLKPDLYLFVNEQENKPSLLELQAVFGENALIKYLHFWTKEDVQNTKNEIIHQLQSAFQKINIREYQQVIKSEFDISINITFTIPIYSKSEIWITSDESVYGSSGQNMHKIHEFIHDQYGKYSQNNTLEKRKSQLFLHLIVTGFNPLSIEQ